MHIEHVAFALPDPAAAAAWYAEHLEFQIVRASAEPPHAHFLLAPGGGVMIELFNAPTVPDRDYRALHSLHGHLAFHVDDVDVACGRLVSGGASIESPLAISPDGDRVAMLRDPWGVPLQFVTRRERML